MARDRRPDRERPVGREAAGGREPEVPDELAAAGRPIVAASWWGTGLFTVSALAAVVAPDTLGPTFIVVALVLFVLGCVAFLWAYAVAVGRSRTDAIGIGGLFFLSGTAPAAVRRSLLASLAVGTSVAVAAAAARPFTGLAFGILVPVYQLGLAGLWSARHGVFAPRRPRGAS